MKAARLHLDFAPQTRRISARGAAMLLVSGVIFAAGALRLGVMVADTAEQADRLATLEARRASVAGSTSRAKPLEPGEAARAKVVSKLSQGLTTPWADLLETLESAPIQSVALLSVEPSVAKKSIRLTAEARNPQEMLGYLDALQKDPRLSSVVLVSHQVQAQTPGSPVRFQVQAGWGVAP